MNVNEYIEKFVNSKDIKEHWLKIGFQPNPLELAFLIWRSHDTPISVKNHYWKELLQEYPDYPVNFERIKAKTLKEVVAPFLDLENKTIAEFDNPCDDAVYTCRALFEGDNGYCKHDGLYKSRNEALSVMWEWVGDDELPNYLSIKKKYIGGDNTITAIYKVIDRENIQLVSICKMLYGKDEPIYNIFESMWFCFPIPFKYGDIVVSKLEESQGYHTKMQPLLLTDLPAWGSADLRGMGVADKNDLYQRTDYALNLHKKRGDITDMLTYGHCITEAGNIVVWHAGNYLDLEYFREEFKDGNQILLALSQLIKKEISTEQFCAIYDKVWTENYKKAKDSFVIGDKCFP